MFQQLKKDARRFQRDDEGVVIITFALVLSLLVLLIGCAVDYSRALHAGQKLTAAIDAAAIAAAKAMKDGDTVAEAQTLAMTFYTENMKGSGNYAVLKKPIDIKINPGNSTVTIDVDAAVETAFTRVVGINWIQVPRSSTAVFATRDIEVGLALDVTGSMNSTVGGKAKIDILKSAVAKFATLMIPANPVPGQKVRVGLAPYSASANLGTYAAAASNNRSPDGCVTERANVMTRYTDDSVGPGNFFKVRNDGTTDIDSTEGLAGNAYACPNARLIPLTDKRSDIINTVNAYQASGWTGGHFGAQWAWNIVSPKWGAIWGGSAQPDPMSRVTDGKLVKAVILMTDGVFNTSYTHDTSAYQALEMCKTMKDQGIIVFSIAFNAPAGAKTTLQNCATAGPDYYADASDEADLDAAFASFAATIKSLRLTQ